MTIKERISRISSFVQSLESGMICDELAASMGGKNDKKKKGKKGREKGA